MSTTISSMANHMYRPDPAQLSSSLFSKLDTKNQGYIDKSDLQSALSQVTSEDSNTSADDIISRFDSDSDGKITKDELTSGMEKLMTELDNQFNQMRLGSSAQGNMQGGPQGMGGMPPPPPPQDSDTGFTKDELTTQLQEIGSSDTKRSSLLSNIIDNFDKADTDGDGKVTFVEAKAYEKTAQASSSESSTSSDGSSATVSQNDDRKVMHIIMQLMQSYGAMNESSGQSSAFTATA